jgi:hypothetical protein
MSLYQRVISLTKSRVVRLLRSRHDNVQTDADLKRYISDRISRQALNISIVEVCITHMNIAFADVYNLPLNATYSLLVLFHCNKDLVFVDCVKRRNDFLVEPIMLLLLRIELFPASGWDMG